MWLNDRPLRSALSRPRQTSFTLDTGPLAVLGLSRPLQNRRVPPQTFLPGLVIFLLGSCRHFLRASLLPLYKTPSKVQLGIRLHIGDQVQGYFQQQLHHFFHPSPGPLSALPTPSHHVPGKLLSSVASDVEFSPRSHCFQTCKFHSSFQCTCVLHCILLMFKPCCFSISSIFYTRGCCLIQILESQKAELVFGARNSRKSEQCMRTES